MNEVLILVEGQTEMAIFLTDTVQDFFKSKGILITPTVVKQKSLSGQLRGSGGNDYKSVRRNLVELLENPSVPLVTMCFDYYGLDGRYWPGYKESLELPYERKAAFVCDAIIRNLRPSLTRDSLKRFLPYIQMHEIECVYFSDPVVSARVMRNDGAAKRLASVAKKYPDLERINSNPGMNPADRFHRECPQYTKGEGPNSHAAQIVEEIGVDVIHEGCPLLRAWFDDIARIVLPTAV